MIELPSASLLLVGAGSYLVSVAVTLRALRRTRRHNPEGSSASENEATPERRPGSESA
ncbi:hypothetical protein [Natronococcus jeotgali]|uniref:hypothetical protein n=1 Tax=Natronococcus jeotgali TaxID=413812 RepID=UPI001360B064|nr:hypothetical protein [Natronococcus jeotgali]